MTKKTNNILLLKNIKSLAEPGKVVTVKAGYSRNYLLPFKFGKIATEETIEEFRKNQERLLLEEKLKRDEQMNLKTLLENIINLEIKKEVVKNTNQLFGKVTNNEILLLLQNQLPTSIKLEKHQIELPKIESLGEYKITVSIGKDIFTKVPIKIITN